MDTDAFLAFLSNLMELKQRVRLPCGRDQELLIEPYGIEIRLRKTDRCRVSFL